MIQKRLLTCLLIDLNKRKITIFCSVGRVYLINTTRLKKKKNWRMRILSAVFF